MTKPRIAILGAGPAGLGAARQLVCNDLAQVTVFEKNAWVGGNAGSFNLAGMPVDFGSHRLHPACDAEILEDIRNMLGDDLLKRPRHGRIRLRSRWIHFPLKPLDLALRLPLPFSTGVALDLTRKVINGRPGDQKQASFASVMQAGLGRTICQDFYFPYVRKIWGLDPHKLSPEQARRRVSNNTLGKMIQKVLKGSSGSPQKTGYFYYPRQGYGQISEAYYQEACRYGAAIHLNTRVLSVHLGQAGEQVVEYEETGKRQVLNVDYVWSTIPVTVLSQILDPSPPPHLLEAAHQMDYRAMILIYLVLEQDRFSEYDAHYFPEERIPISRMSEPKNYSGRLEPRGLTVLCAELPCSPDSNEWKSSDDDLGRLVCDSLDTAGIPISAPIRQVYVQRIRYAYPIYRIGYERFFKPLDEWIDELNGVLTFGRQGLFAHDNTHHALFMAYKAVDCLSLDGSFDSEKWQAYRRIFETHVVED